MIKPLTMATLLKHCIIKMKIESSYKQHLLIHLLSPSFVYTVPQLIKLSLLYATLHGL